MSIGPHQFQLVRIGWALDFGSFGWWELCEHWTLAIWTREHWMSIGLKPFELVRIEWTIDFDFNILEMSRLVIVWWLQAHKVSDQERSIKKMCPTIIRHCLTLNIFISLTISSWQFWFWPNIRQCLILLFLYFLTIVFLPDVRHY